MSFLFDLSTPVGKEKLNLFCILTILCQVVSWVFDMIFFFPFNLHNQFVK